MAEEEGKKRGAFATFFMKPKDEPVEEPVRVSTPQPAAPVVVQPQIIRSAVRGEVDEKTYNSVMEAIAPAGQACADLMEMAATLADTIPDETMRIRAAAKMLTRQGVTVNNILSANVAQIDKVGDSLLGFKMQLDEKMKNEVTAVEETAGLNDGKIQSLKEQKDFIDQQIKALEDDKAAKLAQAKDRRQVLEARFASVEATCGKIKGDLERQKTRLETILGGS